MRLQHKRMSRSENSKKFDFWFMILRIAIVLLIVGLFLAQNNMLTVSEFIYGNEKLPKSFVGYRIVHISDFKNSTVGTSAKVNKLNPDIIVITGGLTDNNGNYKNTVEEVKRLVKIAPVYYILSVDDHGNDVLADTGAVNVTDNIIELSPKEKELNQFIIDNYGKYVINDFNANNEEAIKFVNNAKEALEATKNSKIYLCGFPGVNEDGDAIKSEMIAYKLKEKADGGYCIGLIGNLYHLDNINKANIELEFIGGTFGVNRLSNEIKKGKYGYKGADLFVSSGIGNTKGVTRIFNFPNIQLVILSDGTMSDATAFDRFLHKFIPDVGTVYDNDGGIREHTYTGN